MSEFVRDILAGLLLIAIFMLAILSVPGIIALLVVGAIVRWLTGSGPEGHPPS